MARITKKIVWEKDNIAVSELTFKKNDKLKTKQYVDLKRRVVLIVPIEDDNVYLLREFRPLIGKTVWRVPAGTLNNGENPGEGAARELLEETGLVAKKIRLLKKYNYMGWVKFPIYLFKAEKFKKRKQHLDFYEKINLVKVSRKEAKRIALHEMVEPHHAFALLKCVEYIGKS